MKAREQLNIKLTEEEAITVQTLMNKHAINISKLIKMCLTNKLKELEKENKEK